MVPFIDNNLKIVYKSISMNSSNAELCVVPGEAASGFEEGEEGRLAKIIIDDSQPRERRRHALKRLKQIRGMRIPRDAALQ